MNLPRQGPNGLCETVGRGRRAHHHRIGEITDYQVDLGVDWFPREQRHVQQHSAAVGPASQDLGENCRDYHRRGQATVMRPLLQ